MSTVSVDVDIDDVLEEIYTDDLITELESRSDLPPKYRAIADNDRINYSRAPTRDALTNILKLPETASLGDILQAVTDNYYK